MGCFIGWLCQRKKNDQEEEFENPLADTFPIAAALNDGRSLVLCGNIDKVFDLDDLLRASAEVLGKGTYWTCYKANLEIGPVVVKRMKDVRNSETKFAEMVDTIGNITRQNLLPLIAYHCGKEGKLLIYDYMPMGNLSSLLQRNRGAGKGRTPINWETRYSIVLGVARAIAHIHSQGPTTFHGNIKPSNILLTATVEAPVSDYLLNCIADPRPRPPSEHNKFYPGYCASDVFSNGEVYRKADVYNFGVMLLELLTGKTAIFQDEFTLEKVNLRRWTLSVVEDELTSEIFDLDLLQYEN